MLQIAAGGQPMPTAAQGRGRASPTEARPPRPPAARRRRLPGMSDEELGLADKEIALFEDGRRGEDAARLSRGEDIASPRGGTPEERRRELCGKRGESSCGADNDTMVIAFGGLQMHVGGGRGGGVPPFEFVLVPEGGRAVRPVRARPHRCWYCGAWATAATAALTEAWRVTAASAARRAAFAAAAAPPLGRWSRCSARV